MVSLICRVCFRAKLFAVKLDEYLNESPARQITAKSAAKAVQPPLTEEFTSSPCILMFCAANDQGIARDQSFPAACAGTKHIFKIGAAEASGAVWKWVGDPADVDFIFPGHRVVKDHPNYSLETNCDILTGSSAATAIASGLAALILYCVQLSARQTEHLNQQQVHGARTVTMNDYKTMKRHGRMKEAFLALGTSQASGNKYVEVWHVFESE
ncbi:hypothetical protein VTN00DRAFT_3615 [Thermoascus crustaceus]|uniref:uncharacterized protein n=1 Tax=Thermoascus crustaceus TaxID=5088 RepID=UPI003743A541